MTAEIYDNSLKSLHKTISEVLEKYPDAAVEHIDMGAGILFCLSSNKCGNEMRNVVLTTIGQSVFATFYKPLMENSSCMTTVLSTGISTVEVLSTRSESVGWEDKAKELGINQTLITKARTLLESYTKALPHAPDPVTRAYEMFGHYFQKKGQRLPN